MDSKYTHALKNNLALKIATELNDMESLNAHIQYVDQYSESFLLKTLAKVLSIPEHKIKKSRGALFTHLLKQYEPETAYTPRD